jgi:hypothetical protein
VKRALLYGFIVMTATGCSSLSLHQRSDIAFRRFTIARERASIQKAIADKQKAGALVYYCPLRKGLTPGRSFIIPADSPAEAVAGITDDATQCGANTVASFVFRDSLSLATREYPLADLVKDHRRMRELETAIVDNIRLVLVHDVELAAYTRRLESASSRLDSLSTQTANAAESQAKASESIEKALKDLTAALQAVLEQIKKF